MTELAPMEVPTALERVVVTKLDNGYYVEANTKRVGKIAHYCSNLKGVTKALWLMLEGKTKATKDQAEFMKELAEKTDETKEKEDA